MKIKKKELVMLQDLVNKIKDYNEIKEKRKKQSREEKKIEEYLKKHKASGLKVGDRVMVLEVPMDVEGWTMDWVGEMDDTIYNSYEIIEDCDTSGFRLNTGEYEWCYPYFALEKIKDETEDETEDEDCMNCDCSFYHLSDKENTKFLVEFLDDDDGVVDSDYMIKVLKNNFLSKISVTEL